MTKAHTGKKRIGRVMAAILFVAIVALAAWLVLGDGLGFAAGLFDRVVAGDADEFFYENAADGRFAQVGDSFAVLTGSGLRVFSRSGETVIHDQQPMDRPELSSGGNRGAAWDLGGSRVVLFSPTDIISTIKTEQRIISVSVNDKGYTCVCTERAGYGGQVTVYNESGTAVYRWSAGSTYLISADVRDDDRLLALTVGQNGGSLFLMDLGREDELAVYTSPDLILDADFTDTGVIALTEEKVIYLKDDLTDPSEYIFAPQHLTAYALGGKLSALVVSTYQVGGTRQLITLGDAGTVLGSISISGSVSSLDLRDGKVAVLTDGLACVYDSALSALTNYDASGASRLLLRKDGTVLAAGAYSAKVFKDTDNSAEN